MREIKFRGRDSSGKWHYGCLVTTDGPYAEIIDKPFVLGAEWHQVDPETVGQFTELKDRNGNEIYEGDIIDLYDEECQNPGHLCGSRLEVLWFSDKARSGYENRTPGHEYCSGFDGIWRENYYVVIGNIHDNPELLKGGAE